MSYLYIGECVGFERMLRRWERWEEEYAERGYRTLSIDAFIDAGGYGQQIDCLLGIQRAEDEPPVFHAKRYRQRYLGKDLVSNGQFIKREGTIVAGTYTLPSTETSDE